MALIAMAVHDLEGSGRSELTERTVESLCKRFDWQRHRLFLIDNGSTDQRTHAVVKKWEAFDRFVTVIRNPANLGTAAAINQAWRHRRPGEHCVKMDNDVIIHAPDWVDQLEEALNRDPTIGQCGLKRKDIWENPDHHNEHYRTKLEFLPHQPGEKWTVIETTFDPERYYTHVIGTCVMHSAALLDKVGYMYQPGLYGFDDVLMSLRSRLAGFRNVFLPSIEIDHIDPGGTDYQGWKERHASEQWGEVNKIIEEYKSGKRPLYYNPFE